MHMKWTIVAGARPNFVKIAALIQAIDKLNSTEPKIEYRIIHTGQHYDSNMSEAFFKDLNIPFPSANLECQGETQTELTASILVAFEQELIRHKPDLVIVVGDVTSTMACAITAKKMNVLLAHVEAGIRSEDLTMPEEINRMITDAISDFFFTTTQAASERLINQGISSQTIFFVGNTMIDSLLNNVSRFKKPIFFDKFNLKEKQYWIATIHRPNNVDNLNQLKEIIETIANNSHGMPIIFPVHPRTALQLLKIDVDFSQVYFVPALSYLEFIYLLQHAFAVITDSGGITEETTVLGIPCLTIRDTTERPETVEVGTNVLVGTNAKNLVPHMNLLANGNRKKGSIPELWDGNAAKRIVSILINQLS